MKTIHEIIFESSFFCNMAEDTSSSSSSSSWNEQGKSCGCGRDRGDGGVSTCDQCNQCHCNNKFCGGAQVVETAGGGSLCTDCLSDKVLIDADKPGSESCILCGCESDGWSNNVFTLFGKTLCLSCLRETIQNIESNFVSDEG